MFKSIKLFPAKHPNLYLALLVLLGVICWNHFIAFIILFGGMMWWGLKAENPDIFS